MRVSWDNTWINVAKTIAQRSVDPKFKVGCVIVRPDNTSVVAIGYNGDYRGGPNTRESMETGKSGFIHAEVNALIKADFSDKALHMYLTHCPCLECAKLILNSSVTSVFFAEDYGNNEGLELLRRMKINTQKVG